MSESTGLKKQLELEEVGAVDVPEVKFRENEDDTVTVEFPPLNGSKPFTIVLQNMTWGLVEDIDRIQQLMEEGGEEQDTKAIQTVMLDLFREYIVGGPRAVPFKHTFLVFQAITGYIQQSASQAQPVKN